MKDYAPLHVVLPVQVLQQKFDDRINSYRFNAFCLSRSPTSLQGMCFSKIYWNQGLHIKSNDFLINEREVLQILNVMLRYCCKQYHTCNVLLCWKALIKINVFLCDLFSFLFSLIIYNGYLSQQYSSYVCHSNKDYVFRMHGWIYICVCYLW